MSDGPGRAIDRLGFLLDEHVPPELGDAIQRDLPEVQVYLVGRGDAPPRGTPDPGLLAWIEERGCYLVTHDHASLPVHLADHLAAGRHVPGVVVLPQRLLVWRGLLDDLTLIALAGTPDRLSDRLTYLPL